MRMTAPTPVKQGKLRRSAMFWPVSGLRAFALSIDTHLVKTEEKHNGCDIYLVVDGGYSGTRVYRFQNDVESLLKDV